MSTKGIFSDSQCPSLGFVRNPKRGYFKSVRTCYPVADLNKCKIIAELDLPNSSLMKDICGVGIKTLTQENVGTYRLTLNVSPVATGSKRFIQATQSLYALVGGTQIIAYWIDTAQTLAQVEVRLSDSTLVDIGSTGLTVRITECKDVQVLPLLIPIQ